MALDDPSDEPAPSQPGDASPALQDFRSAFSNPDAQDWAGEVTTRLNDYFQRRQIVDDAAAQGQQFVQNIDQFKSGLVNMVTADPHAVHTALDLVPPTMEALINGIPGGAPDDAEDHHTALVSHMQSEIAAAAVTSAAEIHAPLARSLLANDRIANVLGDDAQHLSTYTDMQEAARARDASAAQGQAIAARQEIADQSGRNYLNALVDPNNGKPRSPPQWNAAVMADNKVPPQDKVALFNAHEQLGRNGDVETDPHAIMDWIHQAANGNATQRDLYPMIGANLSMADAGMLATAVHNSDFIKGLDTTIQAASRQIAPNGDIAETRALGRFVNWLLPELTKGASIDPKDPNYAIPYGDDTFLYRFWNTFKVNGDDILPSQSHLMTSGPAADPRASTTDRPSLGDIFGKGAGRKLIPRSNMPILRDTTEPPKSPPLIMSEGNNAIPMTPANPLIPPNSNIGPSPPPIGGTESGGFFQRKVREQPKETS